MPQSPPAGVGSFEPTAVVTNVSCSLTAAASTTVYTVPNGRTFKMTAVCFHHPSADVGTAGTVNLGYDATAAGFLSAQALTKLGTAAGGTMMVVAGGWATGAVVLNGGQAIKVAPGTAVSGATIQCDIIGYLD